MDIQQPDPRDTSGWITSLLRAAREAGVASDAPQLYADFADTVDQYSAALGGEEIDPHPLPADVRRGRGGVPTLTTGYGVGVVITDDYGRDLAIWARAADSTDVYSCPTPWWWASVSLKAVKRDSWRVSAPSSCWSPQLSCNAPKPMM